jgi:CRP/FNR family cyclic AMP-dependent transcriptional regulator
MSVSGRAFTELLERRPAIALVLLRQITARLRDVSLTQEELAAWTASSREAVSKALSAMRTLGWIETRRRTIVIQDAKALRRAGGM